VNADLCELVTTLAEPKAARVLELYAGHGNLVSLAREAAQLDASSSTRPLRRLPRERPAGGLAQVRCTRRRTQLETKLDRSCASRRARVDPRVRSTGLALGRALQPGASWYVSCTYDARRDLRALAELGYRADRVFCLDMFPQTPMWSVVRLRRAPESCCTRTASY